MGNVWDTCCGDESGGSLENGTSERLPSALRHPAKIPLLQSGLRRETTANRSVRIESVSECESVKDEFESEGTREDEDTMLEALASMEPPLPLVHEISPPRTSSQLRILLNGAKGFLPSRVSPRRFHEEDQHDNIKPLKRVERQESLDLALQLSQEGLLRTSGEDHFEKVPTNLTIAVLDDSAPSRVFFTSSFLPGVRASEGSFVRGKKREEASRFVDEVLLKQPNVVVLSAASHYSDSTTGGKVVFEANALLFELREGGYDGPIVMESTLKDSISYLADAKRDRDKDLAESVRAALTSIRTSTDSIGPLIPPSTHSSWNSRGESAFSFGGDHRESEDFGSVHTADDDLE